MPGWVNEIIKHNLGEKSLKAPFVICLDLEYLLKKVQSTQNNPEKSYTEEKAMHEPSGWTVFKKCSFNKKENKFIYYRGKDCIENLCQKLKESAMEIIDHEKNNNTINQ